MSNLSYKQTVFPFYWKQENYAKVVTYGPNARLIAKQAQRQDFLSTVVSQLVKRRRELDYTQEDVNDMLGVADRLVNKWECGMKTPTSFNLYCWADALDAEIHILPRQV